LPPQTNAAEIRPPDGRDDLIVLTNLVFALNELGRRREALAVCQQAVEGAGAVHDRPLPVSEGNKLAWSLLSFEANELEAARQQVIQTGTA